MDKRHARCLTPSLTAIAPTKTSSNPTNVAPLNLHNNCGQNISAARGGRQEYIHDKCVPDDSPPDGMRERTWEILGQCSNIAREGNFGASSGRRRRPSRENTAIASDLQERPAALAKYVVHVPAGRDLAGGGWFSALHRCDVLLIERCSPKGGETSGTHRRARARACARSRPTRRAEPDSVQDTESGGFDTAHDRAGKIGNGGIAQEL